MHSGSTAICGCSHLREKWAVRLGWLNDEEVVAILADYPCRRLSPACPCGACRCISVLGHTLLFVFRRQQGEDLLRGEAKLGDKLLYAA